MQAHIFIRKSWRVGSCLQLYDQRLEDYLDAKVIQELPNKRLVIETQVGKNPNIKRLTKIIHRSAHYVIPKAEHVHFAISQGYYKYYSQI